jgi:putative sterol carrier protein
MDIKDSIQRMIDRFHTRIENDDKLKAELNGIVKRVNLDLGNEKYSFVLDNGNVNSFQDGLLENPDILVMTDPVTLEGLITRKIKPMKALALRKLRLKGDFEDLLKFRKLF